MTYPRFAPIVDKECLLKFIKGGGKNTNQLKEDNLFFSSGNECLLFFLQLIGTGKRVGVQIFTCPTVIDTIRKAGDYPVFLDINEEYFTTTFDVVSSTIKDYDVLIVSHLFGIPNPDYLKLKSICREYGVIMIDDLCQTYHAKIGSDYIEELSDNYFYSFYFDKPIACSGGGYLKVECSYSERARSLYSVIPKTT